MHIIYYYGLGRLGRYIPTVIYWNEIVLLRFENFQETNYDWGYAFSETTRYINECVYYTNVFYFVCTNLIMTSSVKLYMHKQYPTTILLY